MNLKEKYSGLLCPIGKYPLRIENEYLVCENCEAAYPIIEGIPDLLIEEAKLPEGISSIQELKCVKERTAGK